MVLVCWVTFCFLWNPWTFTVSDMLCWWCWLRMFLRFSVAASLPVQADICDVFVFVLSLVFAGFLLYIKWRWSGCHYSAVYISERVKERRKNWRGKECLSNVNEADCARRLLYVTTLVTLVTHCLSCKLRQIGGSLLETVLGNVLMLLLLIVAGNFPSVFPNSMCLQKEIYFEL